MTSGLYREEFDVTLATLTDGATISYTTDGSDPLTAGLDYIAPVHVDKTMTIRALTRLADWTDSQESNITYTLQVQDPVLTLPAGIYTTPQTLAISCATGAAAIHYTTDGTTPTAAAPVYTGAITLPLETIVEVKALAVLANWSDSEVTSGSYQITGIVAAPVITPDSGTYTVPQSVTITSATNGAKIYYTTNGAEPTTADTLYNDTAFTVSNSRTLKARAFKPNWADSDITTAEYTITGTCADPVMSPGAGTYHDVQYVVLSAATPAAAEIYYTIDTNNPSTLYTAPIPVTQSMTIKAVTYRAGWANSNISTSVYTLTPATPLISPHGGTYTTAQSITISCATEGTVIRYTTDGSEPNGLSPVYTGALNIPLAATVTVKALAQKTGWPDSETAEATYMITGTVAAPVFSPVSGIYMTAQDVTIDCATSDAVIHYTTDGSNPTAISPVYAGAINVPLDAALTIKAIAMKTDWAASAIVSESYTVTGTVAAPLMDPAGGTYPLAKDVRLTSATAGATIHYTTDGSTPTTASPVYSSPLHVPYYTTMIIKALAVKNNWLDSSVTSETYTIDPGLLTVSLSTTAPNPVKSAFPLTITFSAAIDPSTFSAGDIVFAAGSGMVGIPTTTDNITWTALITPSSQGIITLQLAAGAVQDLIPRDNEAALPLTLSYDSIKPTVTLSSVSQVRTNLNPIPVTIVFSEAIDPATFQPSDLHITNGSLSNPTTADNITWITEITPTGPEAPITITIDAGLVADPAGNTNTAAGTLTRTYITAVGYDNSAQSSTTTISGFTVGNHANRFLLVGVHLYRDTKGGVTVSSVTYGGTALTLIPSASLSNGKNGSRMLTQLYGLNEPPIGSADIIVTQTGSTGKGIYALSLYDTLVHAGAATGAADTNSNDTAPINSLTTSLTTTTDYALLADILGGDTVSATITTASGQTIRQSNTLSSPITAISTLQTTFAGTIPMNYTGIADQTNRLNQAVVEIKIAR
jgi:hypothetical protein